MKKTISFFIIVLALCEIILPLAYAEYVWKEKESFPKVKDISVVIGYPSAGKKGLGLTKEQIRTDVELKLRLAGFVIHFIYSINGNELRSNNNFLFTSCIFIS